MLPSRWISTLILAACLIGQLTSFQIEETLLSSANDSYLTDTQATAESFLNEIPSPQRMAKPDAILASSRWTYSPNLLSLGFANVSDYRHNPGGAHTRVFSHSADNRGPPLS